MDMNRADYVSGKPMPKLEVGARVKLSRDLIMKMHKGPQKFLPDQEEEWLRQILDMRGVVLKINEQDRVKVAANIQWTYEGRSWANSYYIEDLELVP
jgi:hypothetical protein